MRIGVTGGTGFIGGHVRDVAIERGHRVVLFDRGTRPADIPPHLVDHVEVFLGDVRDETSMMELAAHVDGIIHLAACLGTQETIRNPHPAAETNILGGLNFLQACAQYGIPGTYIAVGNHFMDNPYSITKTTVERFVRMYNHERGTRVNTVRALNAYGPRQSVAPPFGPAKVRKIMPAFICRALTGAPIEVYGDGLQVSDMIHVRDVAGALISALEHAADGDVFDREVEVGPLEHRTVLSVADAVVRYVVKAGFGSISEIKHLPMRPGELPGARVVADTDTLALVDMDPRHLVPLDDGIAETVHWYATAWLPGYLQAQRAIDRAAAAGAALDAARAGQAHR
jgi:UDP-glucose 4-epimerase